MTVTCENCNHFASVHKNKRCKVKGCRCPILKTNRKNK